MDLADNEVETKEQGKGRPSGPSGKYVIDGKPVYEDEYQKYLLAEKRGPNWIPKKDRPKRPRGRPSGPSGKYVIDGKPVFEEEYQLWRLKQKYGPSYETARGRPKIPSGKYKINGIPVYEDWYRRLAPKEQILTPEMIESRKARLRNIVERYPEVKAEIIKLEEYKKSLEGLNLDSRHYSQRISNYINRRKKEEKRKMKARDAAASIMLPQKQICELCGINYAKEKHHPDYSAVIDVLFVCKQCHTFLDTIRKKTEEDLKD